MLRFFSLPLFCRQFRFCFDAAATLLMPLYIAGFR